MMQQHSNWDLLFQKNKHGAYYSEHNQLMRSLHMVSRNTVEKKKQEPFTPAARKAFNEMKREMNKNFQNKVIARVLT